MHEQERTEILDLLLSDCKLLLKVLNLLGLVHGGRLARL